MTKWTRRRVVQALGAGALQSLLAGHARADGIVGASGSALPVAGASLTILPGREFAADSYVHRPLSPDTPTDPQSDVWVSELQRQISTFYGVATVNVDRFTPPVYLVGPDQPTVKVVAARAAQPGWSFAPFQEKLLSVPIPLGFAPSRGTDKEVIIYQPSTGRYWELWVTEKTGNTTQNSAGAAVDEWRAAWGGYIEDLSKNPGYFVTSSSGEKYGVAATGIPLLAGLMTIEEQQRGIIEHPVHVSLVETLRGAWAYPAQRTDGLTVGRKAIPEGTTFRLPPDLDLESMPMSRYCRMIAKAVQKYGMIVRDKSGAVVFYAENPAGRFAADPYFGRDGLLQCPQGKFEYQCSPDTRNRLRGFPFDKLVALKVELHR